jgi:sec-independent protein translocase protein TatA
MKPFLLLSMPGESEWLLIILVVLLFFGGKKIPELMRGIGKGVREFNDAKEHVKSEIEAGMKEKDVAQTAPAPTPAQVSESTVVTNTSATETNG